MPPYIHRNSNRNQNRNWCIMLMLASSPWKLFAKMELHDCYGAGCHSVIIYGSYFCEDRKTVPKKVYYYLYTTCPWSAPTHMAKHIHCVSISRTVYAQKYHKNFIMFFESWIISSEKMYDIECVRVSVCAIIPLIWAIAQQLHSSKWVI